MKIELLNTDYVEVIYHNDLNIGEVIWKRSTTLQEYKSVFDVLLKYSEKREVPYFLSDITNQGITTPEKRQWFEKEMLPKAINRGLKKSAVVTDASIFKKYYLNVLLKTTAKFGLELKLFGTRDEAIMWLLKN